MRHLLETTSTLVVALLFLAGCVGPPDYRAAERLARFLIDESEVLVREGKYSEAGRLALLVQHLHPESARARSV